MSRKAILPVQKGVEVYPNITRIPARVRIHLPEHLRPEAQAIYDRHSSEIGVFYWQCAQEYGIGGTKFKSRFRKTKDFDMRYACIDGMEYLDIYLKPTRPEGAEKKFPPKVATITQTMTFHATLGGVSDIGGVNGLACSPGLNYPKIFDLQLAQYNTLTYFVSTMGPAIRTMLVDWPSAEYPEGQYEIGPVPSPLGTGGQFDVAVGLPFGTHNHNTLLIPPTGVLATPTPAPLQEEWYTPNWDRYSGYSFSIQSERYLTEWCLIVGGTPDGIMRYIVESGVDRTPGPTIVTPMMEVSAPYNITDPDGNQYVLWGSRRTGQPQGTIPNGYRTFIDNGTDQIDEPSMTIGFIWMTRTASVA